MQSVRDMLFGVAMLAVAASAQSPTLFFNAPFSNVTIAHPFVVTYKSSMIDSVRVSVRTQSEHCMTDNTTF